MSVTHIYEFLYRGVPPDASAVSAFHVQLGGTVLDPLSGEQTPWVSAQLNVAEAEAAGWSLAKCLETINAQALSDLQATRAEVDQLQTERDGAIARAAALDVQNKALAARVAELSGVAS